MITFLSDFGTGHESVGLAHGVIGRIAPQERVIDLTHSIAPGDIRAGALALTRAIQYLPEGVVLAAVDTLRPDPVRAIAAVTASGIVVGPDNGLLSPAVAMVGGASVIVEIANPEFRIPSPGASSMVRDVLAPAAAVLASGQAELTELGSPVEPMSVRPLLLPLPEITEGSVVGEAWWVNGSGHIQTNIGAGDLEVAGWREGLSGTLTVGASFYSLAWAAGPDRGDSDAFVYVDEYGLMTIGSDTGDVEDVLRLVPGMAVTLRSPAPRTTIR
jgi:hypothetical protein